MLVVGKYCYRVNVLAATLVMVRQCSFALSCHLAWHFSSPASGLGGIQVQVQVEDGEYSPNCSFCCFLIECPLVS